MQLKLLQKERFQNSRSNWWSNANKIANKVTWVSKTSPQSNSEINEEEIPRERYISPNLRQKNIDDLRLKEENYWLI